MSLEPLYTLGEFTIESAIDGACMAFSAPSPALIGLLGPFIKGEPGSAASISTDPDNRLTTGTDGGQFVPELTADPLAYYILAKS